MTCKQAGGEGCPNCASLKREIVQLRDQREALLRFAHDLWKSDPVMVPIQPSLPKAYIERLEGLMVMVGVKKGGL